MRDNLGQRGEGREGVNDTREVDTFLVPFRPSASLGTETEQARETLTSLQVPHPRHLDNY